MNILIISSDSPYNPCGGLGHQIRETILNLDIVSVNFKIKYIHLLIPKKKCVYIINEKLKNIKINKIEYESDPMYLKLGNNSCSNFNDGIKLLRCYNGIRENPPDIIHSFDWSSVFVARFIANEYKCKWVMHYCLSHIEEYHDISKFIRNNNLNIKSKLNDDNYNNVRNIENMSILDSDVTITVSTNYRQLLLSRFQKNLENKIITISNGINNIEFERENINIPKNFKMNGNNKIKILFMGRFTISKNLLSIFLSDIPENVDIIFAGKNMGPRGLGIFDDMGITEDILKLKNMYVVDNLRNPERLYYMKKADAIIMPSIHEPFGLVALEALLVKTPLLCSIEGGLSDFLNNDNCINCGITPLSISNSLNKFINMNQNDKIKMVEYGYKSALKFKWENVAKSIYNIYTNLFVD